MTMRQRSVFVSVCCVLFATSAALADWDPGQSYKMHYPQLPNPTGWDVAFQSLGNNPTLADDWLCTQTGPVTDIHFWGSWKGNVHGPVPSVLVQIYSNATGTFSQPGILLWSSGGTLLPKERWYGMGDEGWLEPGGTYALHDHTEFWQYNITNIANPFIQQADTIYWLRLTVSTPNFGWKTSGSTHFMDDAVYMSQAAGWQPLKDPFTLDSLDLAFVITTDGPPPVPEPAALALVGLGLLTLRRRSA